MATQRYSVCIIWEVNRVNPFPALAKTGNRHCRVEHGGIIKRYWIYETTIEFYLIFLVNRFTRMASSFRLKGLVI